MPMIQWSVGLDNAHAMTGKWSEAYENGHTLAPEHL